MIDCPFCNVAPDRVFHDGPRVIGLWDAYPVSPGHALLVTKRHVASWFDATRDEHADLVEAIDIAKVAIAETHAPDGFNIGINIGEAAGQTVLHLHVHVIPRYRGDVPNARGGVRHVIPSKGFYGGNDRNAAWDQLGSVPHHGALVRGLEDPLLPHLVGHLARARHVDIAVAFVQENGLRRIEEHLRDVLTTGGRVRFMTGDYLDVTDPSALHRLQDLEGNIERRIFQTGAPQAGGPPATHRSFHPKAYICKDAAGGGIAFVGSSNLTHTGLAGGVEWNYRVVSSHDERGFDDIASAFEALFVHPDRIPLTEIRSQQDNGQLDLWSEECYGVCGV
jgi:diadenosine tetraphosphate (Ap4A) HIT family hydrolase/HKD family nuclease